jgi:hypothetical protein
MSQVRRHAAAGLDGAVRRCRRKRMAVGALDETGQEKQGSSTVIYSPNLGVFAVAAAGVLCAFLRGGRII